MKPKDLPFTIKSFSSREPSFTDSVFTIPSFYDKHNKEDFPELYKKLKKFDVKHVEICSGNGEWIAERAQNNKEILFIAVEKKFMRVRKIWSKMKNKDLDNLIIISGMGEDFFNHYLDDKSIDKVFINFPDPWPKKRHAKHRIVKKSFIEPLSKKIKDEGSITITTDSDDYSLEIIEVFKESEFFENIYTKLGYTELDETYGGSYFRRLWAELGRKNKLMTFKKMEMPSCVSPKT